MKQFVEEPKKLRKSKIKLFKYLKQRNSVNLITKIELQQEITSKNDN